jgi:hypothetical protein
LNVLLALTLSSKAPSDTDDLCKSPDRADVKGPGATSALPASCHVEGIPEIVSPAAAEVIADHAANSALRKPRYAPFHPHESEREAMSDLYWATTVMEGRGSRVVVLAVSGD